jgi:uncharacterized protein (DUF2267 family)
MSASGLETLDHTVQVTHTWISELDERLGWNNKRRTYHLLKAVLHAVRDWLPPNEAVDLGAQLPALLRGAYYEQWRPAATPVKPRSRSDFRARIDHEFRQDPLTATDDAVAKVFSLLSNKITAGEIEDVRHALPADIRAMWPAPGALEKVR